MNLNSDKKSILIFSDPHQEIDRLRYILKHESYDTVVCLGDWFDSFTYNSEYDLEKTCQFLKEWIFKDNFFTCIGNHDIHYLYDNNTTICSGYSHDKDVFISDCFRIFLTPIRDKFKWFIFIDNFLCSHAGLHPSFLHPFQKIDKENLSIWLNNETKMAEAQLIIGGRHWIYGAGQSRGGRQKFGGLTWMDADIDAMPLDGLKQIYGHTSHERILQHQSQDELLNINDWSDICIDCHLSEYLLITNGKLTIKKFIDL